MVGGCIEKKPKLDMVLRLAWKCLLLNSSTLKGSGPLQRGNCCISRLKKEFNEQKITAHCKTVRVLVCQNIQVFQEIFPKRQYIVDKFEKVHENLFDVK